MRRARTLVSLLLVRALLSAVCCLGPPSLPQVFTGPGMSGAEPLPFHTASRTLHFEWENDDAIGNFVHNADDGL